MDANGLLKRAMVWALVLCTSACSGMYFGMVRYEPYAVSDAPPGTPATVDPAAPGSLSGAARPQATAMTDTPPRHFYWS